jgi:hypothetical protein
MEKQLINEIARIKELLSTNQLITESVPAKTVREIFKSLGEINFKKLFSFATEEDVKLIKSASNTKKTLEAIEATFERLIKSVNWSSLAKDIIGNELFGKNFSKALNNEISKVGKGIKTKEEVIREFDNFFDAHSATKNLEDLKKSLMSEIESKLDDVIKKIPDTSGVLSKEAEVIFLAAGKKMTSAQAELLNDLSKKMNKLSKSEFLQLEAELTKLTLGTAEAVITRLNKAGDTLSKAKLEKFTKMIDNAKKYLNAAATGVRGVFNMNILKAVICILLAFTAVGAISGVKNIPIIGGLLSKWFDSGVETVGEKITPDNETTPENETTPNKGGGTLTGDDY